MNFEGLKNYEFFLSLGYVTIIASILTMIISELVKFILKKKNILKEEMDATEKDVLLSRVSRVIALITYAILYIGNELILKHTIYFDGTLMAGLLSGATLTLTIAKGLYTMIRQYKKEKTVFDKLRFAEEKLKQLNYVVSDNSSTCIEEKTQSVVDSLTKESTTTSNNWALESEQKEEN